MELRRDITLPAALKYSAYRNFWLGMFGAVGGFQVLMFGQFWLIHELTGSPLYLGYVGMANAIPAIILNLIGGAIMSGLSVTGFVLSSEYVGSYVLAIVFMFSIGVFTSTYMISIMSALQMMVPDYMRGRIMGFYGITWNIMPLGGMYAGVLAGLMGTPFAIALGGLLVAIFALGPALLNIQVRNLGILVLEAEETT